MLSPSKVAKAYCVLCFTLASLIITGFASCAAKSWRLLTTDPTTHAPAISALAFIDPNHGWALTSSQLLETTDGGQTWAERLSDERKAFYSLTFVNPTTGWIVGSQKDDAGYKALVMQTTDGGKTWRQQAVNVAPQPNARVAPRLLSVSFCDPNIGWATGSDLIVHTVNGGETWEIRRSGNTDEDFLGIQCVNPARAWAAGQDGLILQTKDGGKSWSQQESGTKTTLLRVRSFGDSGWIVGLDGTLLRTRDGGAKWEQQRLDVAGALFDIHMNGQQGWLVGSEGIILYSKDGGQTWQRLESPTNNDLVSLFFISPKQGWAGGDHRTLLHFSG
jgi:photosystem II stability/assembly factor-like uncharacterized protein